MKELHNSHIGNCDLVKAALLLIFLENMLLPDRLKAILMLPGI